MNAAIAIVTQKVTFLLSSLKAFINTLIITSDPIMLTTWLIASFLIQISLNSSNITAVIVQIKIRRALLINYSS